MNGKAESISYLQSVPSPVCRLLSTQQQRTARCAWWLGAQPPKLAFLEVNPGGAICCLGISVLLGCCYKNVLDSGA